MPNMFGGDQLDPEYTGERRVRRRKISEKQRAKIKERKDTNVINNVKKFFGTIGLKPFDFIRYGYEISISKQPWKINYQKHDIGLIDKKGYIQINYRLNIDITKHTEFGQVEAAYALTKLLKNHGCTQIVEMPPIHAIRSELEHIIQSSQKLRNKIQ